MHFKPGSFRGKGFLPLNLPLRKSCLLTHPTTAVVRRMISAGDSELQRKFEVYGTKRKGKLYMIRHK